MSENLPITTLTSDRHYTKTTSTFTKRTITRDEFSRNRRGQVIVPQRDHRYLINEHAALEYITNHTTIRVPRILHFSINTDLQCQLTLQRVPGIQLENVPDPDKPYALQKASQYIETVVLPQLKTLRSTAIGGLSGQVLVPEVVRLAAPDVKWMSATSTLGSLVFCHNDLYQHNILVDEDTYEVTAILDWEYSGFFPQQFERPLWRRSSVDHQRLWSSTDTEEVQKLVAMLFCFLIHKPAIIGPKLQSID